MNGGVGPARQPRGATTAERILLWLQALPTRRPTEDGYVAEMRELSGLPQGECSRAKAGKIRAWTTRRLDQVARHRGMTVPQLIFEIYEVSDRKVEPKREFRVPDEIFQEYLETLQKVTPRWSPRLMQEASIQFRYVHRMGLGLLVHRMVRALMAKGPERALGEIAGLLHHFVDEESPGAARKRHRVVKQFMAELRAIVGRP